METKKWVCELCGYVAEGEKPPKICPLCGASDELFVPYEED